MIPKRLTRKGLPLLAAVALLVGPLVISAQAEPSSGPAQPAVNPDHVKVLAAALGRVMWQLRVICQNWPRHGFTAGGAASVVLG